MNLRKITDKIFYIGVNDRTTWKFENLWPLPYGVSYNSYIVKGAKKVALIDTVGEASMNSFLGNVNHVLQGEKIDYLIVNHMEPDHSGGIPDITRLYPELKIVGNRITIGMIKDYYNIDDSFFHEIKDNDSIDLGEISLQFVLTPMLHWPETMMTYVKEEGVLFSGDAFGCFGALNGGVIDSTMDSDWYIPELYRYYSNIVGKYGKPVQMALKKLKNIDLKYICSTHGPVWHEKKDEIISIYDRLSRHEGEMGVTIVYGSMYGHTGEIAEIIATRLNERGLRTIKVHNVSKSEMSDVISDAFRYKGLVVGSPTYNGSLFPQIEEFMSAMEGREIKNKIMATFGSFTWASASCRLLEDCTKNMKLELLDSFEMKGAPKKETIERAEKIADEMADKLLNQN